MFQSIAFRDGMRYHRIVDTDFIADVKTSEHSCFASSIITVYRERKLPVAPNLARYYLMQYGYDAEVSRRATNRVIAGDLLDIDNHFPALKYRPAECDCVLRQIKQLQFCKRKR